MKRRRTGNGTTNRQWLYVFWNLPYFLVVKIGIGGDMWKRRRQVDKSAKGIDIPIWFIYIPFAYQLEQFIHSIMDFCHISGFGGSGHTERFFIIAAIPAIILSLLLFIFEYVFYLAAALLIAWIVAGAPSHY